MRSRKERGAKSAVIARVVVVSCRRFTTKARRHKESGFRFKSHSRNTPVAALPPDVRKGSAFPTRPLNHLHNGEAEPRHCVELLWLASRKAGGLPHIRRRSRTGALTRIEREARMIFARLGARCLQDPTTWNH